MCFSYSNIQMKVLKYKVYVLHVNYAVTMGFTHLHLFLCTEKGHETVNLIVTERKCTENKYT